MTAVSAAPHLGDPETGVLGASPAPPSGPVTTHTARGHGGAAAHIWVRSGVLPSPWQATRPQMRKLALLGLWEGVFRSQGIETYFDLFLCKRIPGQGLRFRGLISPTLPGLSPEGTEPSSWGVTLFKSIS